MSVLPLSRSPSLLFSQVLETIKHWNVGSLTTGRVLTLKWLAYSIYDRYGQLWDTRSY